MIGPRPFDSLPWAAICMDYKCNCGNTLEEHLFGPPNIHEFQLSFPETLAWRVPVPVDPQTRRPAAGSTQPGVVR